MKASKERTKRIKSNFLFSMLGFLSCGALLGGGMLLGGALKQDAQGIKNEELETPSSYVQVGELVKTEGVWGVTGFDKDNMQLLLDMIANDENVSFDKIAKLAEDKQTAQDIRLNTYKKENGQDICVMFGGLQWEVVYLSQTKEKEDGNYDTILTLWLSNNTQKEWQENTGLKADQGKFYGFVNGGLYSDWSANWYKDATSNGKADFYPSAMYGTSYIRAVTLNNGGQYATSNSALSTTTYGKNTNSVFAKFTMPNALGSVTDFIVKPSDVDWQENQSAKNSAGTSYNYPNDAWSKDTSDSGFYSAAYNYAEHDGYDTWKDDYIWLPSMAETGYSGSAAGLWKTSVNQRANYDGSTTSGPGSVGGGTDDSGDSKGSSGSTYTYSWLRSGYNYTAD